jgi:hypothetical protein
MWREGTAMDAMCRTDLCGWVCFRWCSKRVEEEEGAVQIGQMRVLTGKPERGFIELGRYSPKDGLLLLIIFVR